MYPTNKQANYINILVLQIQQKLNYLEPGFCRCLEQIKTKEAYAKLNACGQVSELIKSLNELDFDLHYFSTECSLEDKEVSEREPFLNVPGFLAK